MINLFEWLLDQVLDQLPFEVWNTSSLLDRMAGVCQHPAHEGPVDEP